MAGRPIKTTVDYFPHYTTHGKTMFALENQFGNTGYAAWFKLLELLGKAEGHYLDINRAADFHYISAYLRISGPEMQDILNFLSELEAIDPKLYQNGVIWCEKFTLNLKGVYDKRNTEIPDKPNFRNGKAISDPKIGGEGELPGRADPEIRQSKVKESKVTTTSSPDEGETPPFYQTKKNRKLQGQKLDDFYLFWEAFNYRKGKASAADSWIDVYSPSILDQIIAAAKLEAAKRQSLVDQGRTPIYPQGWLSGRRWEDEPEAQGDENGWI